MDLNVVRTLLRPSRVEEVAGWGEGHAWLAGGTWLFSEPQPRTDTLVDLAGLRWPALEVAEDGLTIAATCRIVELYDFAGPDAWTALPLARECCEAFLASFKIWNASTVGGNVCMSLPAGPMISLTAALEGICTIWPRAGAPWTIPVADFVTGNHANVLQPGDLLRSIHLPADALTKAYAMRHMSLTKLGRSAALVIGTRGASADLLLTITAATHRPVQLRFPATPTATELRGAIDRAVAPDHWFPDVHGSAAYKRHVACHFAEQVREELAA